MDDQSLSARLDEDGAVIIKNAIPRDFLHRLEIELESYFSVMNTGDSLSIPGFIEKKAYNFGKVLRIDRSAYSSFKELGNFINILWFRSFINKYYGGNADYAIQTFCTYDYVQENECKDPPRNSFLHVDPYQAIKIIVYLSETTEQNGAMRIVPGTQHIGEKIRRHYSITDLLQSSAYCFDSNNLFYDYSLTNNIVYMEANPGDVIVFNTDILHGGGNIRLPGNERKTVNVHSRRLN